MTEKLYRPNVGIMVINKNGKVFAAHRADTREKAWQMPQGGIDGNEEPLDAAKRELFEETGIKSVTLVAESKEWFFYDFPSDVNFISEKKKTFAGRQWSGIRRSPRCACIRRACGAWQWHPPFRQVFRGFPHSGKPPYLP